MGRKGQGSASWVGPVWEVGAACFVGIGASAQIKGSAPWRGGEVRVGFRLGRRPGVLLAWRGQCCQAALGPGEGCTLGAAGGFLLLPGGSFWRWGCGP